MRPEILAVLPHDTAAFTQGLVWLDGSLYESTGLYGESSLRRIDPATGAVLRKRSVPARYFAEGLAWHRGEFIQLTWKEGEALRWPRAFWGGSVDTARRYRYAGEGWGLATLAGPGDTALWMSNGSDTLYRREAADGRFRVTAKIPVRRDGRPVTRLNELEGARGKILANVWYADVLVVIDPRGGRAGHVVAVVDATELVARSGRRSPHDVLNGIAWDPARDEFYLTGKNWPTLFRMKIPGF